MDMPLEVIVLAVTDVDRALTFYRDVMGFRLDVDYQPHDGFRVVQLTPPGSSCSIQFGTGLAPTAPYLVVADLDATRQRLQAAGAVVSDVRHKTGADWQGDFTAGLDPQRRSYASFADVTDPDGNHWTLQERH
ncbi:VOC family protein [Actinoplanes sp. HUAS TT8]|uniref:VOC family protein n=1 Tax=Actinoplanes sp. HUAS TT8 TaxID=3447453 RepID=UPI003F5246FD